MNDGGRTEDEEWVKTRRGRKRAGVMEWIARR